MTDASKREGDASAFDALVGGTRWFVTDDSLRWGLTTVVDLLTGSGDFSASDGMPKRELGFTHVSLVFGIDIAFPNVFW